MVFSAPQKNLIRTLTGSVNGDLYQIVYSIKIFVKHVAMTQRGEGACVTLPIRIIPLPIKLEDPDSPLEESKTEIVEDEKVQLAVD